MHSSIQKLSWKKDPYGYFWPAEIKLNVSWFRHPYITSTDRFVGVQIVTTVSFCDVRTEQSNRKPSHLSKRSSFCRELAPRLHLRQQGSSHQAPLNENQMLPQKIPTDMETWEHKTIPYIVVAYNKGNPYGRTISTGWCYWKDRMRVFIFYIILTYRLILNAGVKLYKHAKHIHVSYGIEQALNVLYMYIFIKSSFFLCMAKKYNEYICQHERGLQSGSWLVAALAQHLMTHTHLLVEPLPRLFLWGLPVWGGRTLVCSTWKGKVQRRVFCGKG